MATTKTYNTYSEKPPARQLSRPSLQPAVSFLPPRVSAVSDNTESRLWTFPKPIRSVGVSDASTTATSQDRYKLCDLFRIPPRSFWASAVHAEPPRSNESFGSPLKVTEIVQLRSLDPSKTTNGQ